MGCGASAAKAAAEDDLVSVAPKEPSSKAPQDALVVPGKKAVAASPPTKLTPNGPVIFVLGGPGSGKGTQCAKLVEQYGAAHFSAGDLLRDEVNSDSENGNMIDQMIKEGQIVPAQVTIDLLKKAVGSRPGPYLIDGFPRSLDNLKYWEEQCGECALTLFYDVSEEVMEARLLERGKTSGRTDDNIETIQRRFRTFTRQSMPVVDALDKRGLVAKLDAAQAPDDVFAATCVAMAKVVGGGTGGAPADAKPEVVETTAAVDAGAAEAAEPVAAEEPVDAEAKPEEPVADAEPEAQPEEPAADAEAKPEEEPAA